MRFYPLKFKAITQQRIWGGSQLKSLFHVHSTEKIGEYWVVSGHPNATSIVENGGLAGKNLNEVIAEFPSEYLGQSPQKRFPLLIKFLEADDDLSVQIHPNDEYALREEHDYGKTEAWYILQSKPNGNIIYGHSFQNRSQYIQAVENKTIKSFLQKQPISADDFIFVPSQTIHALLAGTTLIEIQQTSDVTYRVYDWDRHDADGKGRKLHIEQAADVMYYGEAEKTRERELNKSQRYTIASSQGVNHEHLVACAYFTIEKIKLSAAEYKLTLGNSGNPDILVVASGQGVLHWQEANGQHENITIISGEAILIPAIFSHYTLQAAGEQELVLLRTFY